MTNNGKCSWRPRVQELRVYSDTSCTNPLNVHHVGQSGQRDGFDGSFAFDNDDETSWRPDGNAPYPANTIWLSFSTSEEIKCVEADNLGEGTGSDQSWNHGIKVEVQNENGDWDLLFE